MAVCAEYTSPYIPEKYLLCAVLERAYRDLEVPHVGYRTGAVQWFLDTDPEENSVSYAMCIEYLAITLTQQKLIEGRVKDSLDSWRVVDLESGKKYKGELL